MEERHYQRVTYLAKVLILSLGFFLFIRLLYHFYTILVFPYDITYGEGAVLRDAIYYAQDRQIYLPADKYPFVVSSYPPLFAWLTSRIILLLGPTFFAPRLLATGSTLICGLLIMQILAVLKIRLFFRLSGCTLFSTSIYVYYWGAWSRVDSLALLFSLSAILVILRKNTLTHLILAALLCVASVATKQTAIAAFLAIVVYLLIIRWKQAFIFGGIFAVVLISASGLLNFFSHGELIKHLIFYNELNWYPRPFLSQIRNFSLLHFGLIFSAGFYLYQRKFSKNLVLELPLKPTLLLIIYAGFALLLTITLGREGASTNYFLESVAALSILVAFGLAHLELQREVTKRPYILTGIYTFIILQFVIYAFPDHKPISYFNKHTPEFGLNTALTDTEGCERINKYIKTSTGPVLLENPGFALINRKDMVGNAVILKYFRRKSWNEPVDNFIKTIKQKEYALIIFQGEAYDWDVLRATDQYYHQVESIKCLTTYRIKVPNA